MSSLVGPGGYQGADTATVRYLEVVGGEDHTELGSPPATGAEPFPSLCQGRWENWISLRRGCQEGGEG